MSEVERAEAEGWLVVLPADASESSLERLASEARARAWRVVHSRGAEQVVVALEGPRVAHELAPVLTGLEADVLPLAAPQHYRRLRRRRRLLSTLVTGLGLSVAAGVVLPLCAFLRPPPRPIVAPDVLRVAGTDELALGAARLTRFREQPVLVIHVAPRAWTAVLARCTVPGECLLAWDAERQRILCPCHGCAFDAQGSVLQPPASTPLVRLSAFEHEGELFVRSPL